MSELAGPEFAKQYEHFVRSSFVEPLDPQALETDYYGRLDELAVITSGLLDQRGQPIRSFFQLKGNSTPLTIEQLTLSQLFPGGVERSMNGYLYFLGDTTRIVGPYVRRHEDQPLFFGLGLYAVKGSS